MVNPRLRLLKPVTVDDMQNLTLQFQGQGKDDGCLCLFSVQLETARMPDLIRVSHVTGMIVCGVWAPSLLEIFNEMVRSRMNDAYEY